MRIIEALQKEGDIRVTVGDMNLAWENEKWVVWKTTDDGPLTFLETDIEGVAVGVLTGHMVAL